MTPQDVGASPGIQQILSLLHLSSPALPIGGFSYSQGLEAAVELELADDEESALVWIEQQLMVVMARSEAPLWCLLFEAWKTRDEQAIAEWNQWFYASRETRELRLETEQMGVSLYKLAQELGWGDDSTRQLLASLKPITLPCMHAFVCAYNNLPRDAALGAYLFAWLENQVAAAIKGIPLGQLAGQRILTHAMRHIPEAIDTAYQRSVMTPPALDTFAPHYAMVAARHEVQFSRLFRS